MQRYLYNKCIQDENIIQAINEINKLSSSYIAGPDGINLKNNINMNKIIKEVKLRLRRCKNVNSLVKKNNIIINLFDRYTYQAVYQIINPIIEPKMNIHNYYRTDISFKILIGKIASTIKQSKNAYIIKMNFEKCFNNISLDKALYALKKLGINDHLLLITIKHLMWMSKKYNGIGINYDTNLGALLCNCYLHELDTFVENQFNINKTDKNKMRDYQIHKNDWIKWLQQRNKKVQCKYYRYLNEIIILTTIKEERQYIQSQIINFLTLLINPQLINIQYNQNKINFLNFHLVKGITGSTWIKIKNEQKIYNEIKQIKIISHINVLKFKKYLIKILNYYNIVNDMSKLLNKIFNYLYYQCRKGYIRREQGKENLYYIAADNEIIDIWKMRKEIKESYKIYLLNLHWIKERDQLINYVINEKELYNKYILFTKQKGKDKITKKYLKANDCIIYNKNNNLILINNDTYDTLHNKE